MAVPSIMWCYSSTLLLQTLRSSFISSGRIFQSVSPLLVRTYQVRSSLKLRCSSCRFVKRKGRLRVVCPKHPRHKQRQG